MLFSILIAHYNNWDYFQACYKSIRAQTYQNYEIIIVDDSSTDNSYEKLLDLAQSDSKIKLFKNEINRGVGYTKKRCVELASGEICGFIDPDDALANDALEVSVQHYEKYPQIGATYSQIIWCNGGLEPIRVFKRSRKIKNNNLYFFNINNEVSHFFTFKKKYYDLTIGINEALTSAVDFDMYLKLYEKCSFYFIKKPLYLYRQHEKGVSQDQSKKEKTYQNWNKVLFDTCKRRNINQIGNYKINESINLAAVIFKKENSLLKKIFNFFQSAHDSHV